MNTFGGLDCNQVMKLLWDYLDRELDDDRRARMAEHLERCRDCRPHAEFEQAFLDLVAAVGRAQPGASPELRARVAALVAPPA